MRHKPHNVCHRHHIVCHEDEGRAVHEKRIHSLMQEDMGLDLDEKIKGPGS
ncbi:hypothetical protein T484DRAFT_1857879 [Baffinella frigidus]|nr:hypothetical protein T484DRAFT_1857879 [Cryptophyta sp. CCMP2293]